MPLLGPADPLTAVPRRVLVEGVSGAGKTTAAGMVERALGLPHTEIDGLFHGAGWVPREEFLDDVRALVAQPAWVTENQYTPARPLLFAACDLVLWVDTPTWRQVWQVTRRTVVRRVRRVDLWNGNREQPLWRILIDGDHVVRYAWRARGKARQRVPRMLVERPEVPVVRVRSRRDLRTWVRSLEGIGA